MLPTIKGRPKDLDVRRPGSPKGLDVRGLGAFKSVCIHTEGRRPPKGRSRKRVRKSVCHTVLSIIKDNRIRAQCALWRK